MDDCLFCQIVAGEISAKNVFEDERVLVIEDIDPQAPTHLLLIPKRHIRGLLELEQDDKELIGHLIMVATNMARQGGFAEQGFRVVINCNPAGGQAVFHLHLHLLGGRKMQWPPG